MKKLLLLIPVLLIAGIFFYACEEQNVVDPSGLQKVDVGYANSGQSCVQLTAGQNIDAGTVCFDDIDTNNDGTDDALLITYNTTGGWELVETHLFIGTATSQIPMTRSGNPIPGQFPYNSGNITGQTTYTITIPFTELGFSCPGPTKYVVAAHASLRKVVNGVVVDTQTGWGAGTRINTKGNWGTYFDIYITCDETTPPPPGSCTETAFAKGESSTCFSEYPDFLDNPTRWGWTNGPLSNGTYTMTLWAGAGQCNINNGTNVGTLTVDYTGSTATVTYNVNPPYSLTEVHLYVGNEILPKKCTGNPNNPNNYNCEFTLAPGQYPIVNENLSEGTTSITYTVPNLSGQIYVVAHATVKGFPCTSGN